MTAGVFDERIAVVVPCSGGFGSTGTLRIRDPEKSRGTMDFIDEIIIRQFPYWYHTRYHEFAGQVEKLPFDAHTLAALIAPRPLLNTNATEDQYNNTLANEVGIRTGQIIYDWMERKKWCRIHWRPGRHGQTEEDWMALFDFADEYFFDKKPTTRFNNWQYPNFALPISWKAPE